MIENTQWNVNQISKDVFSYKITEENKWYDKCLAYFYVVDGKNEEVRFWDQERRKFVEDKPRERFKGKTIEEMKIYVEMLLTMERNV